MTNPLFDDSPWTLVRCACPQCRADRSREMWDMINEVLADSDLTITFRWREEPPNLPAVRKWLIRKERDADGNFNPWGRWIVVAPSGNYRTYWTWTEATVMAPLFHIDELFAECGWMR